MELTKLHDPAGSGQLRVAGFMSGSGTNLVKIIEHEQALAKERKESPFHVSVIFSDNGKSKASEIGAAFGMPVFIYDMNGFFEKRGKPIKDMQTRAEYEQECMKVLTEFDCSAVAYAGYMRKATNVFVNSFLGINVHPADLTILAENGRPKYRGDAVVRGAIRAGEKEIRSTTHIVAEKVDCGPVLMVSAPLRIIYPLSEDIIDRMAAHYQNVLKEKGDWVIFPKTLEYVADGRFARDAHNKIYFDGKQVPQGIKLEAS